MEHILYLSYDGMTDPLGQSQVIPYLAGLSGKGYRFHLISFEKKAALHKEGSHISTMMKDLEIDWHPLSYTKKPPVVSTMRDLSRMKKKGMELIQKHSIKLVHCRSYISGLAGMTFQEELGTKFLFDMRGFWADERVDGGLWKLDNPVYKAVFTYFKKKEKEMLEKADGVISLTENAKSEINSWKIRPQEKKSIEVIPCCSDLDLFTPESAEPVKRQHLIDKLHIEKDSLVLSYLGAIGTWYLLDDMLAFFKVVLKKYPNAIFLFITHEPHEHIEKAAQRINVPVSNLRIFAARRNEVPAALSLSQASVFFIKPSYSKKASSPTKQGEIMAMGIPVICNKGIGDTDLVIERYESGKVLEAGNTKDYERIVEQMDSIINIPAEKIITGAHDFYSLEKGVEKYEKVYKDLLKGKN